MNRAKTWLYTSSSSSSSSAFPARSQGFPLFFFFFFFLVRFLRMWPYFNPTTEVATFRLRGLAIHWTQRSCGECSTSTALVLLATVATVSAAPPPVAAPSLPFSCCYYHHPPHTRSRFRTTAESDASQSSPWQAYRSASDSTTPLWSVGAEDLR